MPCFNSCLQEVGKNVASPVFAWKCERVLLATVCQEALKLDYFALVRKGDFSSFLPVSS